MAIMIEEKKNKGAMFGVIMILLIFGSLAMTAYYLFFSATPLIDKFVPVSLTSLQSISSIKIDPNMISSNPNFLILKQYVNPVQGVTSGRSNPFAPTK